MSKRKELTGKITIEIGKMKHSVQMSSDAELTWKEMLDTCVVAMKQHVPSGVREVDMVEHLISIYGVTDKFVSRLINQLAAAQRSQSVEEAPTASDQQ